MKNIFVLLFCLFNFNSFLQQDLNIDFKPLKSQGVVPEIFTKAVRETIADEKTDVQDKICALFNELKYGK